jgi:hypothetical protein
VISIALDCDGVLAQFCEGALLVVEEVTGRHYEPADVTEFDFTKALGLSTREAREVKAIIGSRQGFAASLTPYPRAQEGVRRLRELGTVFCVTSPWDSNPWWREEREAWLASHFGIDRVHHAIDKREYDADIFVDDRSSHVGAWVAWVSRTPGCAAVFWRTPHNTAESVPVGAHSIASWDALYQLARGVAKCEANSFQGEAP